MSESSRAKSIVASGWARLKSAFLDMDSLDSVEVLIAIEEAFDVKIPDADAEAMTTPRLVVEWLLARVCNAAPNEVALRYLHRERAGVWQRGEVAAVVRAIIVEQTGTTSFDEDSNFRNDIFS